MSTNEKSDVLLTTVELSDEAARVFPQEWQDLPQIPASSGALEDGRLTKCLVFSKKCQGENATDDEILELVAAVKKHGEPVAWIGKLYCVRFPEFEEGKDPTVKEFFDGSYDQTASKQIAVIMTYPHFLETT